MLPIDLCKDEDIADLLLGNSALLEAAKKGQLDKVKKLLMPENVNCRDTQGRYVYKTWDSKDDFVEARLTNI